MWRTPPRCADCAPRTGRGKAQQGIKLLYKTYKIFYAEEETEEMVLEQWEDLKVEINVPTQQLSQHLS